MYGSSDAWTSIILLAYFHFYAWNWCSNFFPRLKFCTSLIYLRFLKGLYITHGQLTQDAALRMKLTGSPQKNISAVPIAQNSLLFFTYICQLRPAERFCFLLTGFLSSRLIAVFRFSSSTSRWGSSFTVEGKERRHRRIRNIRRNAERKKNRNDIVSVMVYIIRVRGLSDLWFGS